MSSLPCLQTDDIVIIMPHKYRQVSLLNTCTCSEISNSAVIAVTLTTVILSVISMSFDCICIIYLKLSI